MSELKKSEDYLYFQNKASHYYNITSAKSKLDTKVPESLRNTIDYHQMRARKHEPHLRDYDIKVDNQTLLKRILSKEKSPLNKQGVYSRYNSFERSFRHRNPHKNQQLRLIEIENQKMRKSIDKAKASVGSVEKWKQNYSDSIKHSRLRSKFVEGLKPKQQLQIETEKFLPERYLKYIQNIQLSNQQTSKVSQMTARKKAVIQKQKLFVLPHLHQSPSKSQLELSPSMSKIIQPKSEEKTIENEDLDGIQKSNL